MRATPRKWPLPPPPLTPEVAALADTHVRIPMLGRKHSLNVATAGGVVLYELLRKYRNLR